MKVFYDYQAFLQRYGGVSRYFVSLINEFEKNKTIETLLPYYYSNNVYYPKKKDLFNIDFKGKTKIFKHLNKKISINYLKNKQFDLFHPTYFDPYFLKFYEDNFVITIHDMIHERFPNFLSDKKTKEYKKLLALKSKKIIAVSENTKKDILSFYKEIPEKKIEVVYHATDLTYQESPPIIREPYILYVGERHTYKNFLFFLSSIKDILIQENISLVCAGGPPFTKSEIKYSTDQNIDERIKHVTISSDTGLANLYHYALAFCYPSLYEGFGIPILEAFNCGCPVLLSNTSCFPEIAHDAALYFDPQNSESIKETLTFVLKNKSYRDVLIQKGYQRISFFSWEKSSYLTANIYNKCV